MVDPFQKDSATLSGKEFAEWLKEYNKKNANGYGPQKPELYVEDVDKTHEKIREMLGGVTKTFLIEQQEGQEPAPVSSIDRYMNVVLDYLPGYYKEYGLTHEDFCMPKLKKHKDMAITKHVMGYADRLGVTQNARTQINYQLTTIGQILSQYKRKADKYYLSLSTDPRAFAMIGGYGGADAGCCFNGSIKYDFGNHQNTFIGIRHAKEDIEWEYGNKNFQGRSFGTITQDNTVMNITNCYGQTQMSRSGFQEIAQQLLGFEEPASIDGNVSYSGGVSYVSGNAWTFYDAKKGKPKKDAIAFATKYRNSIVDTRRY